MHIGALIFPTDLSIRPDRLAVRFEERGFESLWVTEHTHIPASRRTPWPGGPNLPEEYRRTLDPFVALTAAAAVTDRLRAAPGYARRPARPDRAGQDDRLARPPLGRTPPFGIGVGWNEEEMADHGVDPARRRAVAREKVLAMRGCGREDEASFDGEFVRFSPSWSWPKPVQQPHPPVVMGGAGGPVTFRHVVEYCDGWMPIHGRRPCRQASRCCGTPPKQPAATRRRSSSASSACPATRRSSTLRRRASPAASSACRRRARTT